MFSVITPTFNRAHTLKRVYTSLQNQTYKDFDWIIMDDASTDETETLVNSWIQQSNTFSIQYHKLPENKGKPNALNQGFQYCKRPITLIADSDDSFISHTLSELRQLWNTVDLTDNSAKIAAIWTLTEDENGKLVGEKFPHNFWQVGYKERILDRKRQVAGEKWHSWRTSIIKQYGLIHNDNAFVGEAVSWKRINKEYDFLCVNLIHRKYYSSPDGLIQKKKKRIDVEKQKYYYAYYLIKDEPLWDILMNSAYRRSAFEYLKALLYYRDKSKKLSLVKTIFCVPPAIIHAPTKLSWFLGLSK